MCALMIRRFGMWSVAAILALGAVVHAAEGLRIVPLATGDSVVVTFELADAYNDEVRQAISSGLRTTFTYDIELRMVVPTWVDRTIASSIVTVSDQYDNLTRRHTLLRTIDGRVEQASVSESETAAKQWLTSFSRLPIVMTSKLDPNRDYYVRIRARVRPHGASIIGLANTISAQAKFTFVP